METPGLWILKRSQLHQWAASKVLAVKIQSRGDQGFLRSPGQGAQWVGRLVRGSASTVLLAEWWSALRGTGPLQPTLKSVSIQPRPRRVHRYVFLFYLLFAQQVCAVPTPPPLSPCCSCLPGAEHGLESERKSKLTIFYCSHCSGQNLSRGTNYLNYHC